jgi:hypothetical protein
LFQWQGFKPFEGRAEGSPVCMAFFFATKMQRLHVQIKALIVFLAYHLRVLPASAGKARLSVFFLMLADAFYFAIAVQLAM